MITKEEEKFDFNFSDEDLKKIDEVFYKLNDKELLEKLTKKLNKKENKHFFHFYTNFNFK